MFRLLLVTDKKEIQNLYKQYPDWNHQGFEIPTIAGSADAGMRALKGQRFDAISWLLPVRDGKQFCEQLAAYGLYGMETVYDEGRLRKDIGKARRELINRAREQEESEPDDVLVAIREGFLRDILRGNIHDVSAFEERKASLALDDLGAGFPIAVASFRIPEGDRFYEDRWKYGRLRLENALSNAFFRGEGETCVLSLINAHHMRVILLIAHEHCEWESYRKMMNSLSRARSLIDQAFGLSLQISWVNSYPGLSVFIEESSSKSAH